MCRIIKKVLGNKKLLKKKIKVYNKLLINNNNKALKVNQVLLKKKYNYKVVYKTS